LMENIGALNVNMTTELKGRLEALFSS
jgi:hypothetical protein